MYQLYGSSIQLARSIEIFVKDVAKHVLQAANNQIEFKGFSFKVFLSFTFFSLGLLLKKEKKITCCAKREKNLLSGNYNINQQLLCATI